MKADIAELETLAAQATRQRVKDILSLEARRLVTEVVKLVDAVKTNDIPSATCVKPAATTRHYQVKLNNYGKQHSYYQRLMESNMVFLSMGSDIEVRKVLCDIAKGAHFTPGKCTLQLLK